MLPPPEGTRIGAVAGSGADSGAAVQAARRAWLPADLLSRVEIEPRATQPQGAWGWEIAGYLYLGGLGAGAFIVAVLLDWFGARLPQADLTLVGGWTWDWSQVFLYWGPAVTAVGATLLVFHLGRNWFRFFTACLNPRTSWLARGFLILATFILVGILVAAIAVFLPQAPAHVPVVWRALQASGVLFAFGTAIYTGILLRSMKYIPAWNVAFLPALFLASALSTGAMGLVIGALAYGLVASQTTAVHHLVRHIERVEPAIILGEAVLLALYVRHLARGKPEARASARMLLSGPWRNGFWIGIVGAALIAPLLLRGIALLLGSGDVAAAGSWSDVKASADIVTLASGVSVLAGGFVLRLGVLGVGVKEQPPLYGLSRWRAEHALAIGTDVTAG